MKVILPFYLDPELPLRSSSLFDGNGDSTTYITYPNHAGEFSPAVAQPFDGVREAELAAAVPELHHQFGAILSEVMSLFILKNIQRHVYGETYTSILLD